MINGILFKMILHVFFFKLVIDMKQKKFLEKRELSEVIYETFGCALDWNNWYHWILPIKTGGCKPYFENFKNRDKNY
jgi:hypothetical protein